MRHKKTWHRFFSLANLYLPSIGLGQNFPLLLEDGIVNFMMPIIFLNSNVNFTCIIKPHLFKGPFTQLSQESGIFWLLKKTYIYFASFLGKMKYFFLFLSFFTRENFRKRSLKRSSKLSSSNFLSISASGKCDFVSERYEVDTWLQFFGTSLFSLTWRKCKTQSLLERSSNLIPSFYRKW